MKILFLSKRQYTGKDLLDDRFGRLYEIPCALNRMGHELLCCLLSYRRRSSVKANPDGGSSISWFSFNFPSFFSGLYFYKIMSIFRAERPDIIWVSSDVFQCVIGVLISKFYKTPVVVDLYDNYEGFSLSRIPFLKFLFRWACLKADAITVVSEALKEKVARGEMGGPPVYLIPNGVRKDIFFKRDKAACRDQLGIPRDAMVIGTAGAINSNRGIQDLFNAFSYLSASDEKVYLAYAGVSEEEGIRPSGRNIKDFGVLPLDKVGVLVSALDAVAICNKDSEFGRFCFPLKLMETVAAGVPFVAAAVGEVKSLLAARPDCLYAPGEAEDLAGKLMAVAKEFDSENLPDSLSWEDCAKELEKVFILHAQEGCGQGNK